MPDLVVQDALQQCGCLEVARLGEPPGKDTGKIEIGLLEGEAQAGDEIHRLTHRGHGSPKIAADRQFAEPDAAGLHAVEVQAYVFLLLAQGVQDTPTKGRRRVGETQERQSHQFGGQEFVVGEEVQDLAAPRLIIQSVQARKLGLARGARLVGSRRLEAQFGRSARFGGKIPRGPGTLVGEPFSGRVDELLLQRRRAEDPLGKLAQFHPPVVGRTGLPVQRIAAGADLFPPQNGSPCVVGRGDGYFREFSIISHP